MEILSGIYHAIRRGLKSIDVTTGKSQIVLPAPLTIRVYKTKDAYIAYLLSTKENKHIMSLGLKDNIMDCLDNLDEDIYNIEKGNKNVDLIPNDSKADCYYYIEINNGILGDNPNDESSVYFSVVCKDNNGKNITQKMPYQKRLTTDSIRYGIKYGLKLLEKNTYSLD